MGFVVAFVMVLMGFYQYEIIEMVESLGAILGLTINWLYCTLMESSSKQATLGKMALGIVVVDANVNRISFGKATGRFLGSIVSGLIIGIGYIMAAFTERKQGLHDKMAGTYVVKKSSLERKRQVSATHY